MLKSILQVELRVHIYSSYFKRTITADTSILENEDTKILAKLIWHILKMFFFSRLMLLFLLTL